jgi:quercetin dioxygenase-like cupin family protein
MNWVEGGKGGPASYSMKYLYKNAENHEVYMLVRYPAGQTQPPHIHNYGHGIYVLQGKLVTHQGTYGPGSFVWFPPNEVVAHGASADEDLVILFIRHEDMEIDYVQPTHAH